jgi:DNA-binding PadR family transcriptional regulator
MHRTAPAPPDGIVPAMNVTLTLASCGPRASPATRIAAAAADWKRHLSDPELDLTDHEGTFLALVLRVQPVTAYEVSRIYQESPVSSFNTSKGKIYPMIRRLEERGLLAKQRVEGDARGTERLSCTDRGRDAVRAWVRELKPAHVMLEDPLRTKVQSFDLLSPEERVEWVLKAKEALEASLERLDDYGESVTVPFQEFVHDNAVRSTRARIVWLDRMLAQLLRRAN